MELAIEVLKREITDTIEIRNYFQSELLKNADNEDYCVFLRNERDNAINKISDCENAVSVLTFNLHK